MGIRRNAQAKPTIFGCAASSANSYSSDDFRCVAFTYLPKGSKCTEFGNLNPSYEIEVEHIDTDPDLYLYTGEF